MTVFMKQNTITLSLLIVALMMGLTLPAQTDCDPDGDGNPEDDIEGEGEGTDNASGDLSWDLLLNTTCPDQDVDIRLKDYDPSDQCNNSSNLIPETGFNPIKVAIIDSGVRPTSPGRFNQQNLYSYTVSSDGTVSASVAFPHPHGTYSAGVISGMLERNSLIPFPGEPHTFYDYQVLNGELRTSLAAVVAAIEHAVANDVDLISLSIGFVPTECDNIDWEAPKSLLNAAIENAKEQNVIVITSAGNDGNNLEVNPQYPAAYVGHENLVSVGALACEGETPATFSNYGEGIVDLFTTGAFVSVFYNDCFHSINGTSFSTSIVAGKAALHLTKDKNMDKVLCLLRSQSKPFANNQSSIYGIVDVPAIPEDGICANGEAYDPEGGSEADGDQPGNGGLGGFGGKSAGENNGLSSNNKLTVLTSPNPFSDLLRVDIGEFEGHATISLLDGRGRKVFTSEVRQPVLKIDLSHLSTGVYWLNVRNAGSNQTQTIVKQ